MAWLSYSIILVLGSLIHHSMEAHTRMTVDPYYVLSSPNLFETVNYVLPPSRFYSTFVDENPNRIRMLSNPSAPRLMSQNHRFMTKTPERDLHYATILKQQEQATIRHPFQAFQVAKDQASMRGHMLRSTLQTSDDDVYEVESAPVMKAASPYQQYYAHNTGWNGRPSSSLPSTAMMMMMPSRTNPHYQHYSSSSYHSQVPIELPFATLSIESNNNNLHQTSIPQSYYHHQQQPQPSNNFGWSQKRYSTMMDQDGIYSGSTPIEQRYHPHQLDYDHGSESRLSKKLSSSIKVMEISSPKLPSPITASSPSSSSSSSKLKRIPYSYNDNDKNSKNFFMTIGLGDGDTMSGSQSRIVPVIYGTQQSNKNTNANNYNNNINVINNKNDNQNLSTTSAVAGTTTSSTITNAHQIVSGVSVGGGGGDSVKGTPATIVKPTPISQQLQQDPTSSWLDMGAYSSQKGAFGWYTDMPIVDNNNNNK